jgi:hypothetical protein
MPFLNVHTETTKRLAAERQINAAIAHLYRTELECAITLAAAAEGLLPSTNEPHIYKYLQNHPSYKSKEIDFNETINWLKHNVELDTKIIFELEAAVVIARAISKFAAFYNDGPSEWDQFLEWAVARGHWPKPPSMQTG